ncbi:hypothetical protein BDF20DRAFT_485649 [Mycotypha africana]|uniref:uncharacterized protein n=1 Tax=Mycotypha africana TaxID=64632 RepID=UPI002300816E|nr:uncharacterized protein BDF20DRAFT_485649 [Mycotypha africana]KAI8979192.1 hypothetical protein BDF20DRAFT_485649 [Mycotypha africana]
MDITDNPGNNSSISSSSSERLGNLFHGGTVMTESNSYTSDVPIYEMIPTVFPLIIKRKDIKLSLPAGSIFVNDRGLVSYTIPARYKDMDVICTASIARNSNILTVKQNEHIWFMSEELSPCRYMVSLLGGLKAYASELGLSSRELYYGTEVGEDTVEKPPLQLYVMKGYQNGTLGEYLRDRRLNYLRIEPFYFLQMAICLFSMLADAHTLNIGLVDISLDSLYVATDGGIYFSGYRSCLFLHESSVHSSTSTKDSSDCYYSWINPATIKCPEYEKLKTNYLKETDVFLASCILLKLVQKPESQAKDLFEIDAESEKVVLDEQELDYSTFEKVIPIIKRGLNYDYTERLSAKDMLYCFETMRSKALAAHT